MFNSFTGTITEKSFTHVCIDTHGVEWDVEIASTTSDVLPLVGEVAKIYIYMVHTENLMSLYGFSSFEERNVFLQLLKVEGIGPKAAIKILSNISKDSLTAALDAGDVAVLEKVPGIGKKTAAKMILALKGKLTLPGDDEQSAKSSEYGDVIQSLVSMGYDKKNCQNVISKIVSTLQKEDAWKNLKPTEKEDAIFRKALIELAN